MKLLRWFTVFSFLVPLFMIQPAPKASQAAAPTELFFSEYIEGSSNNKALEIFNGTEEAVDLGAGGYSVQVFFNGNPVAGLTVNLAGTVAPGDVFVLAHASAGPAILAQADQTNSSSWYNGDDAVVLRKNGVVIDAIGQIGFDPGSEWGTGLTSTADNTLRRLCNISQGDTNGTDAFVPALEWDGFATDTFAGLGAHSTVCAPPPVLGNCGEPAQLIHAIQGSGVSSPLVGTVVEFEGVVVGDFQAASGLRGFFVQEEDAQADADPATSEGIFVYENSPTLDVTAGQTVRVLGTAAEYYGLTEIASVAGIKTCPVVGGVTPTSVTLPVTALSDWERWEGMLVTLPQTLYVTDNYNLGRYGELELSVNSRLYAPTQIALPGSAAIAQDDLNDRSRIQLDDGSNVQNPLPLPPYLDVFNTRRLDDTITGLTGVLSYSYSSYEVHPVQPVTFTLGRGRPVLLPIASSKLTIISSNLLNYFTTLGSGYICGPSGTLQCRGADNETEFERQKAKIVSAFRSMNPDIAGVIEVENNTAAIQDLVDSLNNAVGAGTYAYINTGAIGTDAIRVGLIYKSARVSPVGAFKVLDSIVDPNFLDTKNRPSLAQTFQTPAGKRFTVVVNHFKSKGSSCADVGDPDTGDGQGNCNLTRTKAAQALVNWLATDPTGSGDADFLIIGDLNAYAREDPITTLKNAGYINLVERTSIEVPHSYTFEGESGTLDYAFASPSFASQLEWASEFHANADEPSALDYNDYNQPLLYSSGLYRYADHDPLIITDSPWTVNRVGDELQISYGLANDFPQYAVLHLNDSYFRMNYGPSSGWGTSLVLLPAFWSGGVYYQGAPITSYQDWVNGDNLELTLQGTIEGLTVNLTVTLEPPKTNALTAHVQANVSGSVALDDRPGEAFKPVLLSSMRVSDTQWDAAAAYAGCITYSIPASGWLVSPSQNVWAKEFGFLGGSSAWKTNAPAVRIAFGDPLQVTGWVTLSSDPNDDNLGLWAASSTLLSAWSYTVTATNAEQRNCTFLPALSR